MSVRTGVHNSCIDVQNKGNSVGLFHWLPNVRYDWVNFWPLDMVWIRYLGLSLRVEGRSTSPKGYSKHWNSWRWIYTKRRHGHSNGTFVANINHEGGSTKQTYKKQMRWKSVTFLIIMILIIQTVLLRPVFNYCLKSLVSRIMLALRWVVSVSVLQVFVTFLYNRLS